MKNIPDKKYIPVDIVQKLADQGKSEREIVDEMVRRGFSMPQIDKAIKEAIKREVGPPSRPDIIATPIDSPVQRHPESHGRRDAPKIAMVRNDIKMDIPEKLRPIGIEQITPPGKGFKIGHPTENIKLPNKIKPIKVNMSNKNKPPEVLPPPSTEIDLDELIESIVNERIKKVQIKIKEVSTKISKIEENVEIIKNSDKEEKTSSKDVIGLKRVDVLEKKLDSINSKIKGLETAFRELSNYFNKK